MALLAAAPKDTLLIALTEQGKPWSTIELSTKLAAWHQEQQNISLVIGGPDGLSPEFLKTVTLHWSLSRLTLPHMLVRIIVAEQIYRAWSIINHHPYHRN